MFEVLKVVPFKRLSLKRLYDKRLFDATEMSATMDLEVGDVFITRIGKVIDHYELVGADGNAIKSGQSRNKNERELFLQELSLIKMDTPKDAFSFSKIYFN